MRETGIIYGNSLHALAAEEGVDALIKEQLAAVEEARAETPDFFSALDAPQLPAEEKLKMTGEVLEGCHPYVVNTAKLLVERRSFAAFGYLVKAYDKAYNRAHNIAPVTAVSAAPLSESEVSAIKEKLKKQLGKEIVLSCRVDPSVLGGVVLRTDGLQIDGSVRGRLEAIKKEIVR